MRSRNPSKLICAVPVSPPEALEKIRPLADETVCLEVPECFQAVGQFYRDFPQIEDAQVVKTLRNAREKPFS